MTGESAGSDKPDHDLSQWPHFLIIGGQRCGTTAMTELARRHPSIHIPARKELHFFDDPEFDDSLSAQEILKRYQASFGVEPGLGQCVGEATPVYLYFEHCLDRIRRALPWVRLIVMLRDPADRAISQYRHERRHGRESHGLWWALAIEGYRLRRACGDRSWDSSWRHHSYRDRGLFLNQLRAVESRFPREQLLVLWNEALRDDPASVMNTVHQFLGVESRDIGPVTDQWNAHPEVQLPAGSALARLLLRFYFRRERSGLHQRYPRG